MQWLEHSLVGGGPIRVVSATAERMFNDLTDAQKAKLPTYKGELLLTEHSAGSITSEGVHEALEPQERTAGRRGGTGFGGRDATWVARRTRAGSSTKVGTCCLAPRCTTCCRARACRAPTNTAGTTKSWPRTTSPPWSRTAVGAVAGGMDTSVKRRWHPAGGLQPARDGAGGSGGSHGDFPRRRA